MEFSYEQIAKYIKGELSLTELQSFEQELSANKILQEEVALYKDVELSLSNHFKFEEQDNAAKATLSELGEKHKSQHQTETIQKEEMTVDKAIKSEKSAIIKRLFPFATLVAAAALLLFIFNPFTNQISPTQMAADNFNIYELDAFMGNSDTQTTWEKATKNYRSEKYEKAVNDFDAFLKENPNNTEALLAKGAAHFELDQTDSAIQTFQQVKNSKTAEWYLALSYLKNEDITKAKPILQNLLNHRKYGAKAKKILSNL